MKTPRIAIMGAGFSGLTLAWQLQKLGGIEIEIFESQDRAGGLIQSHHKAVLVEQAAHAFLASQDVEDLFQDLQVPVAMAGYKAKSKWIFRDRPRKWTLGFVSTLRSVSSLLKSRFQGTYWPQPQETMSQWIERNASLEMGQYLVAPALQGIYGSYFQSLSASLIMGSLFTKEVRSQKGKWKGSVAPQKGMEAIIEALVQKLKAQNVNLHLSSQESLESLQSRFDAVVIATSMKSAGEILKKSSPEVSNMLSLLPKVSLTLAVFGYRKESQRIKGFGCLFPEKENFNSLGVLFNTDLFEGRGPLESETWILKGEQKDISDSDLIEKVKADRKRLEAEEFQYEFCEIIRWKEVLPQYGLGLESMLANRVFVEENSDLNVPALSVTHQGAKLQNVPAKIYLTGNYLGAIGLTKILKYNQRLAERIQRETRGEA